VYFYFEPFSEQFLRQFSGAGKYIAEKCIECLCGGGPWTVDNGSGTGIQILNLKSTGGKVELETAIYMGAWDL
jgi:hypothetical protein